MVKTLAFICLISLASLFTGKVNSGEVRFIPDGDKIETFDDLTALYSGQVILIDMWATWCKPCKEEFEHVDRFDKFVEKHNVAKIYMSTDTKERDFSWRRLVKTKKLKGDHLRMSPELKKEIRSDFGWIDEDGKGHFTIPLYVIVNAKGQIVNPDAPRPSSTGALKKALKRALKS